MPLLPLLVLALLLWLVLGVWVLLRLAWYPPSTGAGRALGQGRPLDPAEAGLTSSTWTHDLGQGRAVPVWDITGHGDGPATVLVHDWGEAPLMMLDRARELAATRCRILVPCLRGHGSGSGRCTLGLAERGDLERLCTRIDGPIALEGTGMAGFIVASLKDAPSVTSVSATHAWAGPRDGLARLLVERGFPSWPVAPIAAMLVQGGSE